MDVEGKQQPPAPKDADRGVRVEVDGALATIGSERPQVNAINAQVRDERAAAAAQVSADPKIRAAVLYGGRKAAGPALAIGAAKQAIDDGLNVDLGTGLGIERLHFAALFATEDQRAGMRSFIENGPGKATFAGR